MDLSGSFFSLTVAMVVMPESKNPLVFRSWASTAKPLTLVIEKQDGIEGPEATSLACWVETKGPSTSSSSISVYRVLLG